MVYVKRASEKKKIRRNLVTTRYHKKLMENFKTDRQTKREKMNQFHEPNKFVVLPRNTAEWG